MTGKKHALLGASSSERWLNCPPSLRLCEDFPDFGSSYAAEGTAAHELCEHKLKSALGIPTKDPTPDLTYYNSEMEYCANEYATYILEIVEAAQSPQVLIEQRVEYSRWATEGFGTADCIVIADGILHVIDYKHGKGVQVEADSNSQMMLYALGALELFDSLYDIESVSMTIFQPRRNNISTSMLTKESLYKWADEVLRPAAELAWNGEGEFRCGDWCKFCKAKAVCKKRADVNMELARHEFAEPALLSDSEIAAILPQIDDLIGWGSDLKDYALQQALRGSTFDGFKVVEGRSNRRYTDETAVADKVKALNLNPYEPPKILGITAMTSLLGGKKKFDTTLDGLVTKPAGKPVLVPDSDKREAINTAATDFSEPIADQ